jgi:hypothetical protein
MWKLIVVAEAPPVIVCVAVKTCLMSITVESSAPTVTVVAKLVPAKAIVNVPVLAAVLVTIILVITVVVADGVVYSVVVVVVVAAPRNKVFDTVAISYYLQ